MATVNNNNNNNQLNVERKPTKMATAITNYPPGDFERILFALNSAVKRVKGIYSAHGSVDRLLLTKKPHLKKKKKLRFLTL